MGNNWRCRETPGTDFILLIPQNRPNDLIVVLTIIILHPS